MTDLNWNRLGEREKEVLAILRLAEGPCSSRDVLTVLRDDGEDVAYTTVSTVLDRLVEKGLVAREEADEAGATRYLHRYDAREVRDTMVDDIVADVADVFGDDGLDALVDTAQVARTPANETTSEP